MSVDYEADFSTYDDYYSDENYGNTTYDDSMNYTTKPRIGCPYTSLETGDFDICETTLNKTSTKINGTKIEETKFLLRNVSGAGIDKGLRVIIDSLACGWMPSASYEGVKVFL